jgi:hypothetical protein
MKKTFGMPSTRNNWPHSPAATMNVADQTATGSSGSGPQKPQRNLRLFRFRCAQKVLVQTFCRDDKYHPNITFGQLGNDINSPMPFFRGCTATIFFWPLCAAAAQSSKKPIIALKHSALLLDLCKPPHYTLRGLRGLCVLPKRNHPSFLNS